MIQPSNLGQTTRWRIVFSTVGATWTDYCDGTYGEAQRYADSLCYEQATRFAVFPAAPAEAQKDEPR